MIKIYKISLLLLSFYYLSTSYASNYKPKPFIAENGTYRGQINTKTYRPKNTYVSPYTKKSGQRVKSYYRTRKR